MQMIWFCFPPLPKGETMPRYWLMKSEPGEFSISDLASRPDQTEPWDGVRNYQARNFMRDEMKKGDMVLFYHSNTKPPGVVGTACVVREGYPDFTAWDPRSAHPDPKSTPESPIWFMVDIRLATIFSAPVPLPLLREQTELSEMLLLRKGNRLSVLPVTKEEYAHILHLAGETV